MYTPLPYSPQGLTILLEFIPPRGMLKCIGRINERPGEEEWVMNTGLRITA